MNMCHCETLAGKTRSHSFFCSFDLKNNFKTFENQRHFNDNKENLQVLLLMRQPRKKKCQFFVRRIQDFKFHSNLKSLIIICVFPELVFDEIRVDIFIFFVFLISHCVKYILQV